MKRRFLQITKTQMKPGEWRIVSRNKLPIWLTQQVGQSKKFRIPIKGLETYFDHFQTREIVTGADYDGGRKHETFYISQPYQTLHYGNIKHMIEVCDKYGIEFDISGKSDHYPGKTVMIEWRQKNQ